MIEKVRNTVKEYKMIKSGDKVYVAVSGGADSVCLLLVLDNLKEELGFTLEAIHVEHKIRGDESKADESFVRKLCERMNVSCHVYNVDAPAFAKRCSCSLEEAARILRYECFDKHIKDGKIATAHHMDDNAETMLHNMIRGTGIEGLRGIKKVRGYIIRPLIEVRREDIEKYLDEKGQSYCIDSTNNELDYTRNKIRHNIMPQLSEINPGAVLHLSRLSKMQDMAVSYIDKKADEAYSIYVNGDTLDKNLLNEDLIIIQTVIHKFLEGNAGTAKDIANVHIEAVLNLLKGSAGREADLPYNMTAVSDYKCVKIIKSTFNKPNTSGAESNTTLEDTSTVLTAPIIPTLYDIGDVQMIQAAGTSIRLEIIKHTPDTKIISKNYTKVLDYDKITDRLTVRCRRSGDYITINDKGDRKSLSRYMIDEKIPKRDRDSVLLLADGQHIMYVAGHRISEHYKIDDGTKRVLKIEITGEENE